MRFHVALSFVICSVAVMQASAQILGCSTSFRELASGLQFSFRCNYCPFEFAGGGVWGTSVYSVESSVCHSAIHAGVLLPNTQKTVSFQLAGQVHHHYYGSVKNRVRSISSTSAGGKLGFQFTSPKVPRIGDVDDELIMVHNNNHGSSSVNQTLTCLPNDLHRLNRPPLEIELRYRHLQPVESRKKENNNRVSYEATWDGNDRIFICSGSSPALDITAVVGGAADPYEAQSPTLTASVGDQIALAAYSVKRLKEKFTIVRMGYAPLSLRHFIADNGTTVGGHLKKSLVIRSVSGSDEGLYRTKNPYVFTRLIVRGCPAGRWDEVGSCQKFCRDCMYSGECDTATGECVCSPGTFGKNCNKFCPPHRFGRNCGLSCSSAILLHGIFNCRGLTFCVRDPKGCSCLPGFQAPRCDNDCASPYYGPNCEHVCNYCEGRRCDRFGSCITNCKQPEACSADKRPLNLPRFRNPPEIHCLRDNECVVNFSAWNELYDDGELEQGNQITGYQLRIRSEQETNWLRVTPPGQGTAFPCISSRGRLYNISLLVMTNAGTASTDYNLRVHERQTLNCLDKQTPNLPRFRNPPQVDCPSTNHCTVSFSAWNRNSDDGELVEGNEIIGYKVHIQSEFESFWQEVNPVYPNQEVSYNFTKGRLYNLSLHVITKQGTAVDSGIQVRGHQQIFECSESIDGIDFSVRNITAHYVDISVGGENDDSCSTVEPYRIMVKIGSHVLYEKTLSKMGHIPVPNLSPNTTYEVTVSTLKKDFTTLPLPPQKPKDLQFEVGVSSLKVSWGKGTAVDAPNVRETELFTVTFEHLYILPCRIRMELPTLSLTAFDEMLSITESDGLKLSSTYQVCVFAVNAGGESNPLCKEVTTHLSTAPQVQLENLQCSNSTSGQLSCTVFVPPFCEETSSSLSVTWSIRKIFHCHFNDKSAETVHSSPLVSSGEVNENFLQLVAFEDYEVSVHLNNSQETFGSLFNHFTTKPDERPANLQNLIPGFTTPSSIQVMWKLPCPVLHPVKYYQYWIGRRWHQHGNWATPVELKSCQLKADWYCHEFKSLEQNSEYTMQIKLCADYGKCSEPAVVTATARFTVPGEPKVVLRDRTSSSLSIELTTPSFLGENPSCATRLTHAGTQVSSQTLTNPEINKAFTRTFEGVQEHLSYTSIAYCCNDAGCGGRVFTNLAFL